MATALSIFADRYRKAIAAVGIGVRPAATTADESVPLINSGSGAPTAANPNGSLYMRTGGASTTTLYARVSGAWEAIQTATGLSATTGAALIGVADANANIVAATVEAALDEIALPPTLTAAAEAGNAIAVTFAGPAQIAKYKAALHDADGLLGLVAAWRLAETGAGAEVTTTAKPTLFFTTDATGAATITVTDVSAAYVGTVTLLVNPASVQAGAKAGGSASVVLTFA